MSWCDDDCEFKEFPTLVVSKGTNLVKREKEQAPDCGSIFMGGRSYGVISGWVTADGKPADHPWVKKGHNPTSSKFNIKDGDSFERIKEMIAAKHNEDAKESPKPELIHGCEIKPSQLEKLGGGVGYLEGVSGFAEPIKAFPAECRIRRVVEDDGRRVDVEVSAPSSAEAIELWGVANAN